jgi:UDP-2-acetamido-3-amino-2,3-dideoxy-glucuronate N-acetyltransferase
MSGRRPSRLAPGLILGAGVALGERVELGANVVIHDGVIIGDDCTIEDGAVLGKPPRFGPHSRAPEPLGEPLVLREGVTICCHAVLCRGASVGSATVIGDHAFLREGASIGSETVIGQGSAIGRGVVVGARVRLQNNVIVAPDSQLEDDVFFGPLVAVANDPTMGRREATGVATEGVTARRGCRVGASAVLLPGVELGVECLVGAGSVVTRAVPDRAVAVGVPARVIGAVDPVELLDASASRALDGLPSPGR